MKLENLPTVTGTIYSMDTRVIPNKKKPDDPPWEFHSIKIETPINTGGKTFTSIPEFQIDRGVDIELFAVGDNIEADYYLSGKKISDSWYKTEPRIVFMKHSSMTTPPPPKTTGNKVQVGSMTNTKELTSPQLKADVFDTPRPSELVQAQDDELSNLPF